MMAFSHMLFGLGTWGLAASQLDVSATPATFAAAFAGSVAPDIDHPNSWIGRRFLPISLPLSAIVGHRGVTHSLIAVIAISFLILNYSSLAGTWVLAFAVGYLSHLGGDFISNSGIPALWPVRRRFSLHLINTGGASEVIFMLIFLVGSSYMLITDGLAQLSQIDMSL